MSNSKQAKQSQQPEPSPYVAPRELAERWQVSRSSVDRIARRASLTRVCLGEGKNGVVRFIRKEVEAYETSRQVKAISNN